MNLEFLLFDFGHGNLLRDTLPEEAAAANSLWHRIVINVPQPLLEVSCTETTNLSHRDVVNFLLSDRRVMRLVSSAAPITAILLKR